MTDQEMPDSPQMPEREIEFQGRKIWVHFPSPEQLLVWQRVIDQVQRTGDDDWNGATVMRALGRMRTMVDNLLVNTVDIDWMDDEMLAGRIKFREVAPIMAQVIQAFQDDPEVSTRPEKRAAAKKAARKTPARKTAAR